MFDHIDPKRRGELQALADRIGIEFFSDDLLETYTALCGAQSIAFISHLAGWPLERAAGSINGNPQACEIAKLFEGLSMLEIAMVVGLVNLSVWPASFATHPETKFGREFAAYMERVKDSNDSGSVH